MVLKINALIQAKLCLKDFYVDIKSISFGTFFIAIPGPQIEDNEQA